MTQWVNENNSTVKSDNDDVPGFAQQVPGGADENMNDESDILSDQDQTEKMELLSEDETMGARSNSLDTLEDEPEDFMEGEIDVKTQMDRTAAGLQASIDNPRSELGAAFENTPGGLEEVEMRTDQELGRRHHPVIEKATKH